MTASHDFETLIDTAISHIARIAYRHRDNPFLTHVALLELAPAHRSLLVELLSGARSVDQWTTSESARKLLATLEVECVPREVSIVPSASGAAVSVDSVHGFMRAHTFWWVVSALWCMTAGRTVDECLSERVVGFRLHPAFSADPSGGGYMFNRPSNAHAAWRQSPERSTSEAQCCVELDGTSFYYRVTGLPSEILGAHPARSSLVSDPVAVRLTELLDLLHERYAELVEAADPRETQADGTEYVPLPVGPPSSMILANVAMDIVAADLVDIDQVVEAWTYADDVIITLVDEPTATESATDFLKRIGLESGPKGSMLIPGDARSIVDFRVGARKLSIRQVHAVEREDEADAATGPLSFDDDGVPIFDWWQWSNTLGYEEPAETEWDLRLGATLRAATRKRSKVADELARLETLVASVRSGAPSAEVASAVAALLEIDDAKLLVLRPQWTEMLACGIVAEGIGFAMEFRERIARAVGRIERVPGNSGAALDSGIKRSFVQSRAQALAVTQHDRDVRGALLPMVPSKSLNSEVTRVRRFRRRFLIPETLISPILGELTEWRGALFGLDAFEAFSVWAASRDLILEIVENIRSSPRFVPLHEACLATHFWTNGDRPQDDNWVGTAFDVFRAQGLIDDESTRPLHAQALRAAQGGGADPLVETYELKHEYRVAIPSVRVDERMLAWHLAGQRSERSTAELRLRRAIDSVVEQCDQAGAMMLVLPEWALPTSHVASVMARANQQRLTIVAGEAPWVNESGHYQNRCWVSVPLVDEWKRRHTLVFPPRNKSLTSPTEIEALQAAGHTFDSDPPAPRIIESQGVRFAALVCYEFADVGIRERLRGKIDVLAVASYNKDWRYFESIQTSCTRDLFCVTVCVNVSQYPGTRIERPTRSDRAVVASVHGSEQPTIVTAHLDLTPIVTARRTGREVADSVAGPLADGLEPRDYKPLPPLYPGVVTTPCGDGA